MKKFLLAGLLLAGCNEEVKTEKPKDVEETPVKVEEHVHSEGCVHGAEHVGDHKNALDMGQLIAALVVVESEGKALAKGANRDVGVLQITPIYLEDVNRIAGTSYVLADRYDALKSYEMTNIYLRHYGDAYYKKTGVPPTYETLARIHNGGPNGWAKPHTTEYWLRVKMALALLQAQGKETK